MIEYVSIYRWRHPQDDLIFNVQIKKDNQVASDLTLSFKTLEEAEKYAVTFNLPVILDV